MTNFFVGRGFLPEWRDRFSDTFILATDGAIVCATLGKTFDIAVNHNDSPTAGVGTSLDADQARALRDLINDWLGA